MRICLASLAHISCQPFLIWSIDACIHDLKELSGLEVTCHGSFYARHAREPALVMNITSISSACPCVLFDGFIYCDALWNGCRLCIQKLQLSNIIERGPAERLRNAASWALLCICRVQATESISMFPRIGELLSSRSCELSF